MLRHVVASAGAIVVASLALSAAPETVTVEGGKIAGTAARGVRVYKGIPVAEPPVGALRRKALQPIVAWSLELGDAVQVEQHLLKAQLDFLEQAQQRRLTSPQ